MWKGERWCKLCGKLKKLFVHHSRCCIWNNFLIRKSRTCSKCRLARSCRACRAAKRFCASGCSQRKVLPGIKSFHVNERKKGSHMDKREAKFILSVYRPDGQDASDQRFAEALNQVRPDPMLERWFGASVAFDATIAEKLRVIEVPPDLREHLLPPLKITPPLPSPTPFLTQPYT